MPSLTFRHHSRSAVVAERSEVDSHGLCRDSPCHLVACGKAGHRAGSRNGWILRTPKDYPDFRTGMLDIRDEIAVLTSVCVGSGSTLYPQDPEPCHFTGGPQVCGL